MNARMLYMTVMLLSLLGVTKEALALALGVDFAGSYTTTSLGSVPGLPVNYGGLTFLDSDTILIGGSANNAAGRLYTIDVTRGAGNHITGLTGSAALYSDNGSGSGIGEYNDGGVVFGPGGVLFTSRWPVNQLGQTKPGSTDEDKIVDLAALGVAGSHAAVNFIPTGFPGAGGIRLVSWGGGQWYSASLVADGLGTFDVTLVTQQDLDLAAGGIQNVPGGPEGFVYIAGGNPGFLANSLLISEYSAGTVGAYTSDASGNPLVATRRDFLTGLSGAEGATIDPVTNDFLFSTFGGGSQVVVVQGFAAPPPPPSNGVPEPSTLALFSLGLLGAAAGFRRRHSPELSISNA